MSLFWRRVLTIKLLAYDVASDNFKLRASIDIFWDTCACPCLNILFYYEYLINGNQSPTYIPGILKLSFTILPGDLFP